MLNNHPLNSASINQNPGTSIPQGDVALAIQQHVNGFEGPVYVGLQQRVSDRGVAALLFDQVIAHPVSDVALSVQQRLLQQSDVALAFEQTVFDPVMVADSWRNWDITVILDGVDVSSSLIGEVMIEAERSAARIAEFNLILSGTINPGNYVGKSVVITYQQENGASWRRFTGVIERPVYDVLEHRLNCLCTDELQRIIDGYSNDQLQSLTGGLASTAVFNADSAGWDALNDLLSTVNKSVELNSAKQLQVNSMENKLVADYVFDDNLILENSLNVQLAQMNELVNQIDISLDVRYRRLYKRLDRVIWNNSRNFCEHVGFPTYIPPKSLVQPAIEDGGRKMLSVSYTPLWATQSYRCDYYGVFINNDPNGMIGFLAETEFRWQQTITESINIKIKALDSIAAHGQSVLQSVTQGVELEGQYPDWGEKNDSGNEPAQSFVPDGNGNLRLNDIVSTESQDALSVLVAQSVVRIQRSHQQNRVVFELPLMPWIELSQTLQINDPDVSSKGIVSRFIERYSFDEGTAITEVELAVSQGGSGQDQVSVGYSLPSVGLLAQGENVIPYIYLDTHVGGAADSEAETEAMTGVFMNANFPVPGAPLFSENVKLKIPFDAVDDNNRLNTEIQIDADIAVQIPDNLLTINA